MGARVAGGGQFLNCRYVMMGETGFRMAAGPGRMGRLRGQGVVGRDGRELPPRAGAWLERLIVAGLKPATVGGLGSVVDPDGGDVA